MAGIELRDHQRGPTTLLFGPQILSFDKQPLDKLRCSLMDGPSHRWALSTVTGLPKYWEALLSKIPSIRGSVPGDKCLEDLESWLKSGQDIGADGARLPNMLLTPLVVLTQLSQYWRYLSMCQPEGQSSTNRSVDIQAELLGRHRNENNEIFESLGFCTGLLSAFAVASSHSRVELEEYGAVAVRLAMLVGALVDAQEISNDDGQERPSKSFATMWRKVENGQAKVGEIIKGLFPDAYISVMYDEGRATVTTTECMAPRLLQQLQAAGITAAEVGLKGHFHKPRSETNGVVDALVELCDDLAGLQLPDASKLALPSYINNGEGTPIAGNAGTMHEIALRAILEQQCDWYGTFSAIQKDGQHGNSSSVVSFGPEKCVPPTMTRELGPRLVHFSDLDEDAPQHLDSVLDPDAPSQPRQEQSWFDQNGVDENAIAVVGMSVKVAGADDLGEFSKMLKTGESQHELIGPERLMTDTLFREGDKDASRKWYGNFIRDVESFDHKFFKRSPRESSTMDPQQRLFLQAAYQAVAQSGYFTETSSSSTEENANQPPDKRHVGVYLGACAGDYEHHVAGYTPNAFTATGNLKSFIPGKVSHHFGWTGPAMTFDTACSASAVAIHTACRNILSGECTAALAGGVATMTNFLWFQNLAGASFLSSTGQCKPFDDKADGYCRGEGIACVFLKRLSDAVADGNPVLGCIASTAVYQNQNCTPLFVPNSPSLSQLFSDVVKKAHLSPQDVSLVEAHGTGTPVGDPAEYESIRLALAGPGVRSKPLPIGSVKGHIGHTEGASGIISLIKIIMMMHEGFIPAQASFSKMSSHIRVSPTDMIEVPTTLRAWTGKQIALINNYGAAGSNASMVVTRSPLRDINGKASTSIAAKSRADESALPFRITGLDSRSISAYCAKLLAYLRSHLGLEGEIGSPTLADVCHNLNRECNPALAQNLVFSCRTFAELETKLSSVAGDATTTSSVSSSEAAIQSIKAERPVILCFGGQTSTNVGLSKAVYEGVAVLRQHLDSVDAVLRSLGLGSIYPEIFSRESISNTVVLQSVLFALQYACARCWLDCGLSGKVVALVGHSFGEITALCVSGMLSLQDAVQLVTGRARLVRDSWSSDPGAMMSVEADEDVVHSLLKESNGAYSGDQPASIACYNGPRSFTLAGSSDAIDIVAATISTKFSNIRSKRLNVTNAFHSCLVEPLVDDLEQIGRQVVFREAVIPLERATESRTTDMPTARFAADHMRKPVFFNHAVQRLAAEYPSAVWLEAGSNSTITIMAGRALAQIVPSDSHHFQAVNITSESKGLDGLTDATTSLWKQGIKVLFWAHHATQGYTYTPLILPPYQFDKVRHWLDLKSPLEAVEKAAQSLAATNCGSISAQQHGQIESRPLGLWTFKGYSDGIGNKTIEKVEDADGPAPRCPQFLVNTGSDKYKLFISGHMIVQRAPICPATLAVDMAIEALTSLHPEWVSSGLQPVVLDMVNHSPICVDPTRSVWLEFEPRDSTDDNNSLFWNWKISSTNGAGGSDTQSHVQAKLHFRSPADAAYCAEFARFERLVTHEMCKSLLSLDVETGDVDILQGRNVYRSFAEIVDYGELYRGVKRVVGRGNECAGRVCKSHSRETWLDVPLSDSFSQVGGLWVNCMTDRAPKDMYIAGGCEMSMRSPRFAKQQHEKPESGPDIWHVFARHHRQSEKLYMTDVFVFDAKTGILTEVMLGIQYARVVKASMCKMLERLTTDKSVLRITSQPDSSTSASPNISQEHQLGSSAFATPSDATANGMSERKTKKPKKEATKAKDSRPDITEDVRNVVSNVSGIETSEITLDAEMADFGIDSLLGMEVAREVEIVFKCTLDQAELMEATSLRKFVLCISNALYGPGGTATRPEDDNAEADAGSDSSDSSSSDDSAWSENSQGANTGTSSSVESDTPKSVAPAKESKPIQQFATSNLRLSRSDILGSFGDVKMRADEDLRAHGLDNIDQVIIAASNRLCAVLVVEAFQELGCDLRAAVPGQALGRVAFQPQHARLMRFVYEFLERDARLVDMDKETGQLTRTSMLVSRKESSEILQELLGLYPQFVVANRLTYYAGKHLSGVLSGREDGLKVIFGSLEGRELVQALYCEHTFNRMNYGQMRDTIKMLIKQILSKGQWNPESGPLKILEMGAGTGGTTYVLAPLLAELGLPVEYTFTDLSTSMVASARRKFGKQYPFMRFAVHDIEKAPVEELQGQHIILASNAIHATHDLVVSATNIRKALREDGFLMMLEMTEVVPFIDLIFGLLEGWWLFDDGRTHAIVTADHWERDLHKAGFGHVDWTDGSLPENTFQRVIIALASGAKQERLPKPCPDTKERDHQSGTSKAQILLRQTGAEMYVAKYTAGFFAPSPPPSFCAESSESTGGKVVIVTGATGSLGSHLVSRLAVDPSVRIVVCVNRRSRNPADMRQAESLTSRGIELDSEARAKLRVLDTDTVKPQLGLSEDDYAWLARNGTHIVHNAWPMSGTRPIKAFEPQFQTLRNLLDLAREMACHRIFASSESQVGFALISSIGVVGHAGQARVPEERVGMDAVLPIGYCEAKWVCERMVDETLHQHPSHFRPMVVRPGQIAGSKTSGVWNPVEHFAFLIKSAQSLHAWPDFDGVLQWVPVNDVAGTIVDLLHLEDSDKAPDAYPVYHIDNPVGQRWKDMSSVLAEALGIPANMIIPFRDWVKLVRRSPLQVDTENPAARLIDFLDYNFERMSCGGLILDTTKAQQHSTTMANEGPVDAETARKYVTAWKEMGFLNS